ncbi:MAG: hypothetical protein H7Z14_13030 [Anaerolineae bacterium]|nr:hypothetical protein [Phycisphaerae bacterium]
MPQPLDYRNPKSPRRAVVPSDASAGVTRPCIPAEFDKLLTKTDDHPAARAIEAQLRKADIAFHAIDDGERAKRTLEIYVGEKRFEQAAQIAATIFARRAKIKKFPKPEIPDTGRAGGDWIDATLF